MLRAEKKIGDLCTRCPHVVSDITIPHPNLQTKLNRARMLIQNYFPIQSVYGMEERRWQDFALSECDAAYLAKKKRNKMIGVEWPGRRGKVTAPFVAQIFTPLILSKYCIRPSEKNDLRHLLSGIPCQMIAGRNGRSGKDRPRVLVPVSQTRVRATAELRFNWSSSWESDKAWLRTDR